MKLELDRLDLKHEHRETLSCSKVDFPHLTAEAAAAVRVVGKATFYEFDRSNYNVVYAPEEERGERHQITTCGK